MIQVFVSTIIYSKNVKMALISHRFFEKFTHHLGTKQKGDVEGKNWVKPLLCLLRISAFGFQSMIVRTSELTSETFALGFGEKSGI